MAERRREQSVPILIEKERKRRRAEKEKGNAVTIGTLQTTLSMAYLSFVLRGMVQYIKRCERSQAFAAGKCVRAI